MAKMMGDIVFKVGEYQNSQGETKARWMKAGALFQGEDGSFFGTLEMIPVSGEGKFSVFERKPKQTQSGFRNSTSDEEPPF